MIAPAMKGWIYATDANAGDVIPVVKVDGIERRVDGCIAINPQTGHAVVSGYRDGRIDFRDGPSVHSPITIPEHAVRGVRVLGEGEPVPEGEHVRFSVELNGWEVVTA